MAMSLLGSASSGRLSGEEQTSSLRRKMLKVISASIGSSKQASARRMNHLASPTTSWLRKCAQKWLPLMRLKEIRWSLLQLKANLSSQRKRRKSRLTLSLSRRVKQQDLAPEGMHMSPKRAHVRRIWRAIAAVPTTIKQLSTRGNKSTVWWISKWEPRKITIEQRKRIDKKMNQCRQVKWAKKRFLKTRNWISFRVCSISIRSTLERSDASSSHSSITIRCYFIWNSKWIY